MKRIALLNFDSEIHICKFDSDDNSRFIQWFNGLNKAKNIGDDHTLAVYEGPALITFIPSKRVQSRLSLEGHLIEPETTFLTPAELLKIFMEETL